MAWLPFVKFTRAALLLYVYGAATMAENSVYRHGARESVLRIHLVFYLPRGEMRGETNSQYSHVKAYTECCE